LVARGGDALAKLLEKEGLRVFVDGKPYPGDPAGIVLRPHELITIESGDAPLFAGPGFHHRGPFGGLDAAATYLGLTDAQLRTRLESGKSLADVAKAQNKSVDGLVQAIVDAAKKKLDAAVDDDVRGMLAQGLTGTRRYGEHGERRGDELSVFVNSFAPPPRMLVFGAIDFAAAVARVGKFLGYHVTVCDARKVFATPSRFPDADEVRTYVASTLTR